MGAIDNNSVRQKIIRLEVGGSEVFPIERAEYVTSVAYRVGRKFKRKYTCPTTENQITVIRTR